MDVAMGHVGTAVNALAVIVVAVLVIILGLRPAVKAILTARPAESSLPVAVAPNQAGGTAAVAAEGGAADTEPVNLIEDVARKMNRTPQKRLEQIVELDEAEVAAVLRQWLRQQSAA
jgi:flagellar M-ring protein FliF